MTQREALECLGILSLAPIINFTMFGLLKLTEWLRAKLRARLGTARGGERKANVARAK